MFCAPHPFHPSDRAGDVRRMLGYAAPKLAHEHIADCFNHRANVGNRYIVNPPGVDARVHQHNEIGNGEVDWDAFFATLRDLKFDGVATVCVFGWEEEADAIHRRMLSYAAPKLAHVHIADCYNHRANVGNRYIVNPPGVDARIHQHNEIGNGEVDWDQFFATLRELQFAGVATVCVFGWEEDADDIHRRMLERVTAELRG